MTRAIVNDVVDILGEVSILCHFQISMFVTNFCAPTFISPFNIILTTHPAAHAKILT